MLKVSGRTFEVESEFHTYVEPQVHEVGEFCTEVGLISLRSFAFHWLNLLMYNSGMHKEGYRGWGGTGDGGRGDNGPPPPIVSWGKKVQSGDFGIQWKTYTISRQISIA